MNNIRCFVAVQGYEKCTQFSQLFHISKEIFTYSLAYNDCPPDLKVIYLRNLEIKIATDFNDITCETSDSEFVLSASLRIAA